MNEEKEQHDLATRESLWSIACALAHLWLTNAYLRVNRLPTESTYWIYDINLGTCGWGRDLLKGKRIKVTVELEDWEP